MAPDAVGIQPLVRFGVPVETTAALSDDLDGPPVDDVPGALARLATDSGGW